MPTTLAQRTRTLLSAIAVALTPWLAACAGGEADPPAEPAAEQAAAADRGSEAGAEADGEEPSARRYEVRGQVVGLPDPADPLSDLVIRHEAIPRFVGIDGAEVGMDSMAMPFPLAPGVTLEGLEPGDKVAFTLEVEWQADPAYRIVRLEELAAETELELAGRKPPGEGTEPAAGGLIPPPEDYPIEEPPVV